MNINENIRRISINYGIIKRIINISAECNNKGRVPRKK